MAISKLLAVVALGHRVVTPHAARLETEHSRTAPTVVSATGVDALSPHSPPPPPAVSLRGQAGGHADVPGVNHTLVQSSNVQQPAAPQPPPAQEEKARAPCACTPHSDSWVKCQRLVPKCIWIDLGAADGNTLKAFLNNQYGPVGNCPSSAWEAMLVEANPRFNQPLEEMSARWPGSVHLYETTAAYMCSARTNFYLDTVTTDHNYWGSSLSPNAADVRNSGLQKVSVPMVNLNKMLYEQTIPGDWVMVKMDIEGAEWDILPCLALSPSATLIDRMFVEFHNQTMGLVGTDQGTLDAAQQMLRMRGVDIPQYFSNTL